MIKDGEFDFVLVGGLGLSGRIYGLHPCRPPFGLPSAVAIRSRRTAEPKRAGILKPGHSGRLNQKGLRKGGLFDLIGRSGRI